MITAMVWVIIVIRILVLLMILVLKMTKKYHITWYWCQNIRDNMVGKRVKKFGQGPPPLFGQCPKEINFLCEVVPKGTFCFDSTLVHFRDLVHGKKCEGIEDTKNIGHIILDMNNAPQWGTFPTITCNLECNPYIMILPPIQQTWGTKSANFTTISPPSPTPPPPPLGCWPFFPSLSISEIFLEYYLSI